MTNKEKQLSREMISLIENIKEHTDMISTDQRIPQLELEMIVSKICCLYEKAVTLKYLHAHEDESPVSENIPQTGRVRLAEAPSNETAHVKALAPAERHSIDKEDPAARQKPATAPQKSIADKLQKQAVSDLKSAIGLNEKLLFTKKLFRGDSEAYRRAIEMISCFDTRGEARKYIQSELASKYEWHRETEAAASFAELVDRKFS